MRNFRWSSTLQLSQVVDKVSKSDADPSVNALTVLGYGDGIAGAIVPLKGKSFFACIAISLLVLHMKRVILRIFRWKTKYGLRWYFEGNNN